VEKAHNKFAQLSKSLVNLYREHHIYMHIGYITRSSNQISTLLWSNEWVC